MKKALILSMIMVIAACKTSTKKEESQIEIPVEPEVVSANYPELLEGVFEAHGGLETWKVKRTLVYDLPKKDITETHTIDLWSRKDKVETDSFSMGTDGSDVWLLDAEGNYQGDPVFYHNLMFYFYAMPFVLADDGIVYSAAEDLEYEGESYPGIRIAYETGVGTSPKDEYFIHVDSETGQMAWLGYTVTYRTGEISDIVKWIRYDDWQTVDGLTLPKSITWYNYDGPKILDARSKVSFENVGLSTVSKPDAFYDKPEGAIVAESKMPGSDSK